MLAIRRSEQLRCRLNVACRSYFASQSQSQSAATQTEPEYTEQAEYPPIKDLSFRARKKEEAQEWHEAIRNVSTVEEKLIKINMPRYYGYKVVQLGEDNWPYNCLPATQHYTRTAFESMKTPELSMEKQLPATSTETSSGELTSGKKLDALVQAVKGDIEEGLEYAHDFFRHKHPDETQLEPMQRERILTQLIVEQVNRALLNSLLADNPHLHEVEIDYNPRHEAFWSVGGIDPPKSVVKSKEGHDWQKEMAKDSIDRWMQYKGTPYLAIRHRHQLPLWKSEAESVNMELSKQIPRYNLDPRTLGFTCGHQHGTNIPGFWPGSPNSFGCISYQSRAHMLFRPASYGADDFKEALHAQAIQASFAWLLAQANYNGFNTFNDLTYPMNTQTIITNGRDWSFYEYQLNTLLIHNHHVDENASINFCRGTNELQLYQEISDSGKFVGLNEQVLRYLVQFYTNAPTIKRSNAELQPYLHPEYKRSADYANEEQRIFLEDTFKHIMSNRPRHLELPEIYLWEKIYKIDNKTRPMEARRRFFELKINPWKRTLDQHQKEYIPRQVRPEGPKSKKKWKNTYYP